MNNGNAHTHFRNALKYAERISELFSHVRAYWEYTGECIANVLNELEHVETMEIPPHNETGEHIWNAMQCAEREYEYAREQFRAMENVAEMWEHCAEYMRAMRKMKNTRSAWNECAERSGIGECVHGERALFNVTHWEIVAREFKFYLECAEQQHYNALENERWEFRKYE
jgi:hypothetical protein